MYFVQWFYGFTLEAQMDPTVESKIFKSLKKTKLVFGDKEDGNYMLFPKAVISHSKRGFSDAKNGF